jgi:plasmid stability protein
MAQIIVRNLDSAVKAGLRRRAGRHGRSMEEEVRDILRDAVKNESEPAPPLGGRLAARFAGIGNFEAEEMRGTEPRPARFDE